MTYLAGTEAVATFENRADNVERGVLVNKKIDESRTGNLDLVYMLILRQGVDQGLRQLARVLLQRAGELHRAGNRQIAVRSLAPEDDDDLNEVFVLGEVASPGRFEYDAERPISILKALSLAGGLGPFAARGRIQVREAEGQTERMRLFDYDGVEEGMLNTVRDLDPLQDGAIIVVPERGLFE